jgi:glycosyltransferase involved in cell wall biosynthesis
VPELVSILIPAYNASRWLADSVGSALAQTWPDKEIIIVDDGSMDDTLAVARSFEAPNVKVVTQANTGAPGARNHALRLAQGDYIQWLDSDDVLHPEKIERQMSHTGNGKSERLLLTCAWGKFFFRTAKASFSQDALWRDLSAIDWILARFNHSVWMNPAVWLVSRRLTELAGPWDSRLARSGDDDGEYICRVVAASDGVKFVEDARCYYRIGTIGSLNWNMESNDTALDSLLLSLQLCTRTLIKLEDSERTRQAALSHLRMFASYFYGSDGRHVERLQAIAAEFGGRVEPPRMGAKYYPLELVLGARRTKRFIRNWRAAKLLARRELDRYLHRAGV